jgi:single-strand DNA-binding protein
MVSQEAYQYEAAPGSMPSVSIDEVDFSPAVVNSVSVLGTVGKKPELRFFENGNKVASWSIAFTHKKDGETQWFNVDAWGPLAEVVAAEVDKGQRVVVEGRLKVDSWTTRDNEQRKSLTIAADAVKRVRTDSNYSSSYGGGSGGGGYQQQQQQQQWNNGVATQDSSSSPASAATSSSNTPNTSAAGTSAGQLATTEEMWMSYFEDPSGWYDNRPRKVAGEINPKSPDFKRREGGRESPALWIDSRTTPGWVKQELQRQDQGGPGMAQQDQPPF